MTDFALKYADGAIDLVFAGDDVALDQGLETAVLVSLFTDRWVPTEELPAGVTDQRGWWGDLLSEIRGDEIGSKLWLLEREKQSNEVLERAREYSEEALQWLIDDGIATSVVVATEFTKAGMIGIEVNIQKPSGESGRYRFAWEGQKAAA